MAYRQIESYGSTRAIEIQGQMLPAVCLVEDDDSNRIFITDTPEILRGHWDKAIYAGAYGLLWLSSDGWMYQSDHSFERNCTETPSGYLCTSGWVAMEPASFLVMEQQENAVHAEVANADPPDIFVNLHTHTEHSALDGVSKVKEIVDEAVRYGQTAIAVTDHGTCGAHPHLQTFAEQAGIKPIFGIEAYFVNDRFMRTPTKPKKEAYDNEGAYQAAIAHWQEQGKIARDYWHLILWAENDEGLRNIWAMSTEANREGLHYKPRMDWDTLERHSEGVLCSTACLRGPLAKPIIDGDHAMAAQRLGRLLNIFGDRLYLELHCNQLEDQKILNRGLIEMGSAYNVPTVIAVDSHYPCCEDKAAHQVWIAAQTNKDLQDDGDLFAGGNDYHIMGSDEVRKSLSYLPEAIVSESIKNCSIVADRCNARLEAKTSPPIFSRTGGASADVARLVDLCIAAWPTRLSGKREPDSAYQERFETEMRLLIKKGFCGYFLMVSEYCRWAKSQGCLVGPGRGSGGGSLVAYLAGITEIDPVDGDLIFERFLTEGRTELPDFDIDFPSSWRDRIMAYINDRWGGENIVRVGTNIKVKNKGVIRSLSSVLKTTVDISWEDIDAVCKLIDQAEASTAGLGIAWDQLWEEHADVLQPYRDRNPVLFGYCDRLVGRIKSLGKHAAGVVISTDASPLISRLPMRMAGDEGNREMVADFDMNALAALGMIKFDFLTLRTLDTLQRTIDLVKERKGITINVYDWKDEYLEKPVWDALSDGRTLGVFQIETAEGTRLTKRFRPQSLADLSDVITLVRPGPTRSGLTEKYFRRRAGTEAVTFVDPRLEPVLGKTLGCIVYQEDIMKTCMTLAGYTGEEADTVRSILGKKKVDKIDAESRKFIPACVARGMEHDVVEELWNQMAEFAKYSFNRAHAFAYAVLGYWAAWLKYHYPIEFLTAALSNVDADKIPDFINEARRLGFKVLPPDINLSGRGFTPTDDSILYGLEGIKGLGPVATSAILDAQPFTSFEDFLERKGKVDAGKVSLLARIGAFDSLVPNRHQLEFDLAREASGESTKCVFKDERFVGPNGLPCHYDWANEPVVLSLKGIPKKQKPLPKRCTVACRNYTAPEKGSLIVEPYTNKDIREIEQEIFGMYLSSTPFDRIPAEELKLLKTSDDVDRGPDGEYVVAGIVLSAKSHIDRGGSEMGFVKLYAQDGPIDLAVFSKNWKPNKKAFKKNALTLVVLEKKGSRCHAVAVMPVPEEEEAHA